MPSINWTDPVVDGPLQFSGISVTEVDVGFNLSFVDSASAPQPIEDLDHHGLHWGGFSALTAGAGASQTLTFDYDVESLSPTDMISSIDSLYVIDLLFGSSAHMVATANVYNLNGDLIATQTYTSGGPASAPVNFVQAQAGVHVTLTVSMYVDIDDTTSSGIGLSVIDQSFGTTSTDQLASIGDYVWLDLDGDGLQTAPGADPGIEGVTVQLMDASGTDVLATTTTDSTGFYLFDHLIAGTYTVRFLSVDGFDFTLQDIGGDDSLDSDVDIVTGTTGPITLEAGDHVREVDAGLTPDGSGAGGTAALGDYVWVDTNGNGLQDESGTGLVGVTVNLLNAAGTLVLDTKVTDSTGFYAFTNLRADTYQVQFVGPSGYVFTSANGGTNDAADSDADIGTGLSGPITLTVGEINATIDAGVKLATAELGNFVWHDLDGDGVQGSGESGIDGVTVNLLDANNVVIGTEVTDSSGAYLFTGLTAGDYRVEFVGPGGYVFSGADLGGNDASDSDADQNTGLTGVINLSAGEVDHTVDAGLQRTDAQLGNYVWVDSNGDGDQDTTEAGLAGVTVNLLDAGGVVLDTAVTNSSGEYLFTNLNAGTYRVEFVAPTNYAFTIANFGTNDGVDSDANTTTGLTGLVTLTSGEANLTVDAGLVFCPPATASLGNYVWNDCDQDGKQDFGENGISGVTVQLMNASGSSVLATTTTNSSGYYQFSNLQAGTYQVYFGTKSGYVLTAANQGLDDSIDSDANTSTRLSGPVTLTAGQSDTTVDAGMYYYCPPPPPPATACLGNYVWNDCDKDGKQDYGESGIGGVTVQLMNSAGTSVLATTTTNSSGYYQFSNLQAGTYQVYFGTKSGYVLTAANQGLDDTKDSDANTSTRLSGPVTLTAGQNNTVDAGMYYYCPPPPPPATACLGNYVWNDCDKDGKQDYGENGIGGVTVQLMNSAGTSVLATTTTNSSGYYQFSNLQAGTYQVYFGTKSGYVLTAANQGADDTKDSDANTSTRLSGPVTLTAGQNNTTVDAGMYYYCPPPPPPATACLGNYVWNDCDQDGKQDYGENGISGVTVQLMNSAGTSVLATTTTNSSGYYQFSNLQAGTYQVYFSTKSGYVLTAANQGADDSVDSDANTSTRLSGPITLTAGQSNNTVDAGMYYYCPPPPPPATACLGNYVWNDCDKDGKQDAGEGGISGVTVQLMNSAGTSVLATTTTNSSGYYQFSNLQAGTYQVYFGTKSGYVLSAANQGADDGVDSDANTSTRLSGAITLTAGQTNNTVDAGMYYYCPPPPPPATASIGNFVWNDCDQDGKQDAGEGGISGVTVQLMNSAGTSVLATTTTNSTGYYQFSNLAAGTYQVYFGTKSGYTLSAANQGLDDSIDSDANTSTRLSGAITLTAGQTNNTVDAGMYATSTGGGGCYDPCGDDRREGLTPGFWSQHLKAWDGADDTKYANLVGAGTLGSVDVLRSLPNGGKSGPGGSVGVLLGDSNGNGATDGGEKTLFVRLDAAQKIINSSESANDARQILMRHALATQLNIYNGKESAGGLTVGSDLISKAVQWLKGEGGFIYSDGSSGDVDRVGTDGVLDCATSGSCDFNTYTGAFGSATLSSSSKAWHEDKSLGLGTYAASGEEIKNALQAFNEDRLVTSADGSTIGWNNGSSVTSLRSNDADGLWSLLRSQGVI